MHKHSSVIMVASKGRPEVLERALPFWQAQEVPVVFVVTDPADLPKNMTSAVTVLMSPAGLTKQRNTGLNWVGGRYDFVIFFDDDFLPTPGWLDSVVAAFEKYPACGAITGGVLADGMIDPSLTWAKANELISKASEPRHTYEAVKNPYGCNMALRMSAMANLRFDERLPAYGWLEDWDIGGALRKAGWQVARVTPPLGVHLGVQVARQSGVKMGYSQIVNNIYIWRKGHGSGARLILMAVRNVLANLVGVLKHDPRVDRLGRLKGNIIALKRLMFVGIDPEYISNI